MAGYKETCINDNAISLWSFDGDPFDPVTRKLLVADGEPELIIDEIDNQNPATLISDHPDYLGYRMGMQSLVVHEQTDQCSMAFGYYGAIPDHPSVYPKAYLTIPHSITYAFPNLGSFTIELILYKIIENYNSNTKRVIIRKKDVFDISIDLTTLYITHPGGSFSIPYNTLFNKTIHLVLTWDVKDMLDNSYKAIAKLYINSRIEEESTYTYQYNFPNTNISSEIEIAGRGDTNDISLDRQTTNLTLDQIAIYNTALSDDTIANHYSKIFPYEIMIKNDNATNLWTFGDSDSISDYNIFNNIANWHGLYIGNRNTQILRRLKGPTNIPLSYGCMFQNGGHAVFIKENYFGEYIPFTINHDYTFEWWFNTTTLERGVMFSSQQLEYPFSGILVQINMRNNLPFSGNIQFTESTNDVVLNSLFTGGVNERLSYNDGKWHHIAIIRDGDELQLWLDGELHTTEESEKKTIGKPGQIVLMNCMPGILHCTGILSELAYYSFPLQEQQIQARVAYAVAYIIKGIVTLLGVPYQATLRFYLHSTGVLLQELQSDPDTGEYLAYFQNNSYIDIIVFDKNDLSVRYRAYGPILPSEVEDLPITI